MRAAGIPFALSLLAATPTAAGTIIVLGHSGDDGASLRVAEAVEKAFAAESEFAVCKMLDCVAQVGVTAPSDHVRLTGDRIRMTFAIYRGRSTSEVFKASCKMERLDDCGAAVVARTRKVLRR